MMDVQNIDITNCITSMQNLNNYNSRGIFQLNMTFGQELIVLHTTHSMLGIFLVNAWRKCGDLSKEHSISVH